MKKYWNYIILIAGSIIVPLYAAFMFFIYIGIVFPVIGELWDPLGLIAGEFNTWLYAEEFEDPELYWDFLPCETLDELKVLSYSSDSAKVYYVHDNYQTAYVAHFVKEDGKWVSGPYGYLCWAEDHIAGNHDTPAAYWWFYDLKKKYEKSDGYKPPENSVLEQNTVTEYSE